MIKKYMVKENNVSSIHSNTNMDQEFKSGGNGHKIYIL